MTAARKSFWNLPLLNSRTNKQKVTLPEMIFGYFLGPLLVLAMTSVVSTYYLTFYRTYDDIVASGKFLVLLPLISIIPMALSNIIVGIILDTIEEARQARRIEPGATDVQLAVELEELEKQTANALARTVRACDDRDVIDGIEPVEEEYAPRDEAVEDAVTAAIDELQAFFRSIGMPARLADFGLTADDIDPLIQTLRMNKGEQFGAFQKLTLDDARTIYESSL